MNPFPTEFPSLTTERLSLRAFRLDDAETLQRLLEEPEVTGNMVMIPHPYPPGAAAVWLETVPARWAKREVLHLAITQLDKPVLMGCVTLRFYLENEKAELAYWLGKPFWGNGYVPEAGRALVDYGFHTLGLHKIEVFHMTRNHASGRVIEKIGFHPEGIDREGTKVRGEFVDMACYGLLRREWAG